MIVKTLFLAKIIHRIGAQNLHGKKGLLESLVFLGPRACEKVEGVERQRHLQAGAVGQAPSAVAAI
jgi:hypothetical protein